MRAKNPLEQVISYPPPDILQTEPYDAVISDYQMPGMNRITFLKEIRNKKLDIPFILFTGLCGEEMLMEAMENGADFYVQIGGDPSPRFTELGQKVRLAIEQRRTRQAREESGEAIRLFSCNS